MTASWRTLACAAALLVAVGVWQWTSAVAQVQLGKRAVDENPPVTKTRFEFIVLQMTDAKYLGDTPSYRGRNGLKGFVPRIALGDSVTRDQVRIGSVTNVEWDRPRDALDIEFAPEPFEKIRVGDVVWISLNPVDAAGKEEEK